MKKKLILGIVATLVLLILAVDPIGLFRKDDKRYALNLYGEDFHYTRGLEAFYNENGELKSMEVYIIYDSDSLEGAISFNDSEEKYPEAVSSCVVNDDGSVKIANFLTSKSIEAGALEDKDFFMANSIYDKVKTEEDIQVFLESQIQLAKENGIPADDTNYIIINGKNAAW